MRLYKCKFEYVYTWGDENSDENVKKRALIARRVEWFERLGIRIDDGNKDHPMGVLLDGPQMVDALAQGFNLEVVEARTFAGAADEQLQDAMTKFNTMAEKLLHMPAVERSFNSKCEVHMPGQALATYNEVMLLEDSCSDVLQTHLDTGWRMIAACPQPDSRRPDYILGRFNPQREAEDARAQRGYR